MARRRSQKKLELIAQAALDEFTRVGYKNAQMVDIARLAQASVGTLYLYVESKETLFRLAFNKAGGEELPTLADGPVRAGSLDEAFAEMERRASAAVYSPRLVEAWKRDCPETTIEGELRAVIEELFDDIETSKHRVRLIERCARDWPELTERWYGQARRTFIDLWLLYLEKRIGGGFIRSVPDAAVAARLVTETCAWFAMHRYGDYDGSQLPFDGVRSTVLDLLVHSLLSRTEPPPPEI